MDINLCLVILPFFAKWYTITAIAESVVSYIVDTFAQKLNATVYQNKLCSTFMQRFEALARITRVPV